MNSALWFTFGFALWVTLIGSAQAGIPSGLTKYKLKHVEDISQVFAQAKDLGVTDAEIEVISKAATAAIASGAYTALSLDNKHPTYVLSFAGITASFESGKEVAVDYMNRSAKAVYNVEGNKITGKETLDNGSSVDVTITFDGADVSVARTSKSVTLKVQLTQM
ncbi:unnamed protein product [Orchesella dallaii]|uniref:Uncharacterized protein n=1 Tax=Orchesella dallaii TaxID=48710 RepID=A0ABP1Q306_9HEXA